MFEPNYLGQFDAWQRPGYNWNPDMPCGPVDPGSIPEEAMAEDAVTGIIGLFTLLLVILGGLFALVVFVGSKVWDFFGALRRYRELNEQPVDLVYRVDAHLAKRGTGVRERYFLEEPYRCAKSRREIVYAPRGKWEYN
ncbi:MAG: hypothetical protein ACUVRC_10725 [Desulfotomaculales bacterium]